MYGQIWRFVAPWGAFYFCRAPVLKESLRWWSFDRGVFCRIRLAVVLATLTGYVAVAGCNPEGTASAPKLKGNKDEIQKALQSGGAKPDKSAKKRKD